MLHLINLKLSSSPVVMNISARSSMKTNYFEGLKMVNKKYSLLLFIVFMNILLLFFINDNVIYCMDDNSSNIPSSNNPTVGITINTENAFKYIGLGGLATGVGIGGAKILKTVPAQSRLKLVSIIAGISGAAYTTTSITSDLASNRVTSPLSKKASIVEIPDVEFEGVVKFGEYTIKTKINNNELSLSDLKKITSKSTERVIDNLNVENSSSTPSDYYTITDSHNINSMLESGDLINIINNNPYLKLEFVLLFVLGMCLSSLFSLTVITILNKYGDKLNNYFTNKYILMYINFNKKYLNILMFIWIVILYMIILLAIYITYNLIYYYEDYLILEHSNIANSLIIFGTLFKNRKNNKNDKNKINVNTSL